MATIEEDRNLNIEDVIDKVADLLNEATISNKDMVRLANLRHVQELILKKNPALLDNFLEEVLSFQLDKSCEIKKFVISFIEDACKRDADIIFKVIDNFRYLLFDENVNVQKRAFLAMITIYKSTIKRLLKLRVKLDDDHMQTWQSILDVKNHIAAQLDSENDGIRTTAIKFIEALIILYSPRIKESLVPASNENDFSIDLLGNDHPLLDKAALAEEGRHHMRKLLEYTLSTHVSSVNLISSICVLSNVAKQRPEYMEVVLETYSKIIETMPPTLGKSQVSTVRKQVKLQIVAICRNHCCVEFQTQIATMLTELGTSANEIAKIVPKMNINDLRKRPLTSSTEIPLNASKKSKVQPSTTIPTTPISSNANQKQAEQIKTVTIPTTNISSNNSNASKATLVVEDLPTMETFMDDLAFKLNQQENVTDLVMVTMAYLPEQMPQVFQNTYKPVSNAGTAQQIKSLARMLTTQFNDAGILKLSPSVINKQATQQQQQQLDADSLKIVTTTAAIDDLDPEDDVENDEMSKYSAEKMSAGLKSENEKENENAKHPPQTPMTPTTLGKKLPPTLESIVPKKSSNKMFKLNEVARDQASLFDASALQMLLNQTHSRILKAEDTVGKCKEASLARKKVLIETTVIPEYDASLTSYIFEEPRKRVDIALQWVYSIYLKLKKCESKLKTLESINNDEEIFEVDDAEGGTGCSSNMKRKQEELLEDLQRYQIEYDRILYNILENLHKRPEQKDLLFSKFICMVPYISESGLHLLKTSCLEDDNKRFFFAMNTLSDLIVARFAQREELLTILLDLTHVTQSSVRENALGIALNLYERPEFRDLIQGYSFERLKILNNPNPPRYLVADLIDESAETIQWSEETAKMCLYLFLELMSANHANIHPLAQVYVGATPEVKRVILKMLEVPIKKMGMDSVELLKFLQDFPVGSETLVLRIIHILTEKSVPTLELINKVRDLYATKLPDVRFLIPILTSLTKAEIIAALPQLIKLTQPVVKEVFNRLLGINVSVAIHKSPVSPAELLVALHQIDSANSDLKSVIYATSLCFAETKIYTQEILAAVIKQLIDVTPIPTLYMRTVIQSLQVYPKLSGFVVIMMQRLIGKQIWKYPKVWEGFIKCCQRIKPISHQILLQLPSVQLKDVFVQAPDLKEHICKHVQSNTTERTTINKDILDVIDQGIASLPPPLSQQVAAQ